MDFFWNDTFSASEVEKVSVSVLEPEEMDFVSEENKQKKFEGTKEFKELEENKKQMLEDSNSDFSPEENKQKKLEDTKELEKNMKQIFLEENKRQILENSNSDSSPEKMKQKLEENSSSSSDPSSIDLCNESEGRLLMTDEEIFNFMFNPANYSDPEERERDIRTYHDEIRAIEAERAARSTNKKKYELPKEKLESHGLYGIFMAEDSDEYSDAEERAEDFFNYHNQVKSSGGFDVEYFPKVRLCGMIAPVQVRGSGSLEDDPLLGGLSTSAIEKFNKEKGRQYTFNRVIKATARPCEGSEFYITFEATEADSTKIFEAIVYLPIHEDIEVMTVNPRGDLKGEGI